MLRSAPTWASYAVLGCVQLAVMTVVGFAEWRSWPEAIAFGVDMLAVLGGTSWWGRWRDRRLDGLSPSRSGASLGRRTLPPWARPAAVSYVVIFAGLLLDTLTSGRPAPSAFAMSALGAVVLVVAIVALYNRRLGRSADRLRSGAPPKSRVKA